MQGVGLKNTLTIDSIEIILSEINVNYTLNIISDLAITSVSDGRSPVSASICFVEDITNLIKMSGVLYIVPEIISDVSCIVADDPRNLFIKFLEILQKKKLTSSLSADKRNIGVSRTAQIHPSAVIENDVAIGEGTVISAGCVVKSGTSIGRGCIVRENTVIGCDGIALYKNKMGEVLRFPHLASTLIGNNVEIGANCVVVRGTLTNTSIADEVVIGNLCNIGHGVSVQDKVWLSVGTVLGGNSMIEANSTIGLGVSIKDNLNIGTGTSIGMGSVVTKNTDAKSFCFGNPAKPIRKIKTGPVR
jgi:acetyltransferase-like isoleucine patch superfamily enzyme